MTLPNVLELSIIQIVKCFFVILLTAYIRNVLGISPLDRLRFGLNFLLSDLKATSTKTVYSYELAVPKNGVVDMVDVKGPKMIIVGLSCRLTHSTGAVLPSRNGAEMVIWSVSMIVSNHIDATTDLPSGTFFSITNHWCYNYTG